MDAGKVVVKMGGGYTGKRRRRRRQKGRPVVSGLVGGWIGLQKG